MAFLTTFLDTFGNQPCRCKLLATFICLFWIHWFRLCYGHSTDFCEYTLATRLRTCPDLPTFQEFNATEFEGRWYEIGSSAILRNSNEAGRICNVINYSSLPAVGSQFGGVINVSRSYHRNDGPLASLAIAHISSTADEICEMARQACSDLDPDNSDLFKGILEIDHLLKKMERTDPEQGYFLSRSKSLIESAIVEIRRSLNTVAEILSQIQITDAQMNQAQRNPEDIVETLESLVAQANYYVDSVTELVQAIGKGRRLIEESAARDYGKGESGNATSFYLVRATFLIQSGERNILANAVQGRITLREVIRSSTLFLLDRTGPSWPWREYADNGLAVQTPDSSGKLRLEFKNATAIDYWILAVDLEGDKYNAALVYTCEEDHRHGRALEQSISILSRNSMLSSIVVQKFLNYAQFLNINHICSNPFIFSNNSLPTCMLSNG